jgi:hypothetical protein
LLYVLLYRCFELLLLLWRCHCVAWLGVLDSLTTTKEESGTCHLFTTTTT